MSSNWQPTSDIGTLQLRAELLRLVRLFFYQRNVLEVETPQLSRNATTDPNIDSLDAYYQATINAEKEVMYLHTSPEFPMKRLLASGSGAIYQVCKVFRQGERGRLHNPEFTLLEWYRPGMDYRALMHEVEELVLQLLPVELNITTSEYVSYREAFKRFTNIDPFESDMQSLIACAKKFGIGDVSGLSGAGLLEQDRDAWLNLLLAHCIEPNLGRDKLTFLYDFPVSQASLARVRDDVPAVAERFELYINGVELANGFQELTDSDTQSKRFEKDCLIRKEKNLMEFPVDNRLLTALAHGLADCSGVALGIDRLCMLVAGVDNIDRVITFPFERA